MYSKGLVYMIMEADKSQGLQGESEAGDQGEPTVYFV